MVDNTQGAASTAVVGGLAMGTGVGAGIALAAGVVSIVSAFKKSKAEQAEAKAQEQLRRLEADEMQRRATYNQDLLESKLNSQFGDYKLAMAQTATSSETRNILGDVLLSDIAKELDRAKSEAQYAINMKLKEAAGYSNQAKAIKDMLPYQIAGSALGTATDVYSVYKNK